MLGKREEKKKFLLYYVHLYCIFKLMKCFNIVGDYGG